MTIVLLGPPGSGKGTQGQLLREKYHLPYIATGNIVREFAAEAGKGNTLADEIHDRMVRGVPQPDEIINRAMEEKLATVDVGKGVIFDAYPLSEVQAVGLTALVGRYGLEQPLIIYLSVNLDSVLCRLKERKFCRRCHTTYLPDMTGFQRGVCDSCGGSLSVRPDDMPDVVRARFEEYRHRMEMVSAYYEKNPAEGTWIEIDGERTIPEIHQEITERIGVI